MKPKYEYARNLKAGQIEVHASIRFYDRNGDAYIWLLGEYIYRDSECLVLPVKYYFMTGNAILPDTYGDGDFRLVALKPLPRWFPKNDTD